MRVALINPNTSAATTEAMVALARAEAAGAFAVEGVTAGFGAPMIVDEAALAVGAQAVAALAAGTEAVVIGGGPLAAAARALRPRFAIEIVEPVPAAARAVARLLARQGGLLPRGALTRALRAAR